ncbi:LIC_12616 family protein [Pseudomonas sp. NPDC098747]|uniref:phage neck terminator protein n=1 Tax=Pseudomonas sp. NPDC098747 TaxID=3364487 RepID=UPI00383BB541
MIDVLGAMYDLVEKFASTPAENILRAWPNRVALPPHSYAVMTLINTGRRGTNSTDFAFDPDTEEDGEETDSVLRETMVQIDFVGADAAANAGKFELLSRSARFCDFLEPYGIAPLFADTPREMTKPDGTDQFAVRYVITLTISYWDETSVAVPWFDDATLTTEVIQ